MTHGVKTDVGLLMIVLRINALMTRVAFESLYPLLRIQGGPGFNSRPGGRLSWLMFFVVLLSLFRHAWQHLKIGHDQSIQYSSQINIPRSSRYSTPHNLISLNTSLNKSIQCTRPAAWEILKNLMILVNYTFVIHFTFAIEPRQFSVTGTQNLAVVNVK